MAKLKPFVTDEQRIRLEPFRPKPQPSAKGGSKPRGNRQVFDGIIRLWPTGAGWNHLADRYPSASTCWRRLQPWEEPGVWLQIWSKFLSELEQQGQLDSPETLADGSLAWAKKGAHSLERPKAGRMDGGRPRQNPVRIIADKGYDSDPLGQRRLKGGIELICR